ncbi:response regulator transcription factor [Pseudoteredinibacter isoporae]|uniref:response regulator transcription factor n=1 Tax=Pseudoteredinibacter isoporae TaxID=570281 RepID=UPI003108F262
MTEDAEKLLLVDDDEIFLHVLQRAFKKRGFDVHTANTITEALALCEHCMFSRAVVDLKLAEESGLHLIDKLKQKQADLAIVMLTGYSSISTAVEAIKLGALNYLCKPADADDILHAFEQAQGNANVEISNQPPSVNRLEWEHIQRVLNEHDGNISATARALGMHRRTLQRKLQKRPVKQ